MTTHLNTFASRAPEHHALPLPALRGAPAAARTLLALLQRMTHGTLHVQWPDGSHSRHGTALAHEPSATLHIHHWRMCAQVLKAGDIGFAEAYIAGDWSTPQLVPLLRLCLHNRRAMEDAIYGRWWGQLGHRLRHLLNRNSKANARKNIHAHYDLGNAFYAQWLDSTMNYSSAVFEPGTGSMEDAQRAKVRRALRMAQVQPGDRVLEIGCGWGALAEIAAREYGVHVTGITLSDEQAAFARRRLADAGLADRADIRILDYRDVTGTYDAIVSVEMVEAVGERYWPGFMEMVAGALRPGGRAAIQMISIDDAIFEGYRDNADFIQAYIFPGGLLISESRFRALAETAGLTWQDRRGYAAHYAETLRRWRIAFDDAGGRLKDEFDERFIRLWRYYLMYCEGGFRGQGIDVAQVTLLKQ
jgi:cyclopropane-fatty-acyl-phospholipid synthase